MNKSFSNFGIFIEKIRREKRISAMEIANKLKVSKSYFSLVEHGEREVPLEWREKINEIFSLNEKEKKELEKSIISSNAMKKISIDAFKKCMINAADNVFDNEDEKEIFKRKIDDFVLEVIKLKNDM